MQPEEQCAETSPDQIMSGISPYFDIDKSIDESEQKLKYESSRDARLLENRSHFQ